MTTTVLVKTFALFIGLIPWVARVACRQIQAAGEGHDAVSGQKHGDAAGREVATLQRLLAARRWSRQGSSTSPLADFGRAASDLCRAVTGSSLQSNMRTMTSKRSECEVVMIPELFMLTHHIHFILQNRNVILGTQSLRSLGMVAYVERVTVKGKKNVLF